MHVWNTCMFYMDTEWFEGTEFLGYGGMSPHYRVMELDIHEKDLPRLEEMIEQYGNR